MNLSNISALYSGVRIHDYGFFLITVVSWVSAHQRLHQSRFQPTQVLTWDINCIHLYESGYIDRLPWHLPRTLWYSISLNSPHP